MIFHRLVSFLVDQRRVFYSRKTNDKCGLLAKELARRANWSIRVNHNRLVIVRATRIRFWFVLNGLSIEERRFNRSGFTTDWTRVYQSNETIRQFDLGSSLHGSSLNKVHVYLWGTNVPTGHTASEEHFTEVPLRAPRQRDLPNEQRPVQISCSRGQFHSHALLLTDEGSIYAIGSNYKGNSASTNRRSSPVNGHWLSCLHRVHFNE